MSNSAPSDTDSATPSFEAEAESSIEDSELAAQIDILVSEINDCDDSLLNANGAAIVKLRSR